MWNQYLGRAAYVVSFALILIPMFDASTSVLPLRPGEARWRYGSIGLLSNSLLIPMAGVLCAFVVANALGHRRTLRALGVVAWLSCLACVVAIGTFALDALQSQRDIRPEMRLGFVVASSTAAVKLMIGGLAFALFGVAGLKGLRSEPSRAGRHDGILVRDMARQKPELSAKV